MRKFLIYEVFFSYGGGFDKKWRDFQNFPKKNISKSSKLV